MQLLNRGKIGPSGSLGIEVLDKDGLPKPVKAPLSWQIKNKFRKEYVKGKVYNEAAKAFTKLTGIPCIIAELELMHIKADGTRVDYGVVGRRVVTDTGVAFLVDDWDSSVTDITTMNYHGSGTGSTAENQTDSALETESTTQLNPDNTRATGTQSQPAANQYRSVGTNNFDATQSLREHGLLSDATVGSGVLWDRTVHALVTVGSGEAVQYTYTCTITAGS